MRRMTAFILAAALCLQLGAFAADTGGNDLGDPLRTQQWALANDGSFLITPKRGGFPVFDVPLLRAVGVLSTTAQLNPVRPVAGVDIGWQAACERFRGQQTVTVALIDTGVDTSHPDLAGSFWVNPGEIPGNGIDDDHNGYVDDENGWNFYGNNKELYTPGEDWHGTHCAGTIAAVSGNGIGISGIVPDGRAKIMVLKALGGREGTGTADSIVRAIAYAEANGAAVCNLSLGTSEDDPALLEAMKKSKMLFVVAAGNGDSGQGYNADKYPSYPAAYNLDNVISVANLTCGGTLAQSSNYGRTTADLAAPGTNILSTVPGGYAYMSGTSMAAPMVTAAAAMLFSMYPSATAAQVRDTLCAAARPVAALEGVVASGGMLDLDAALARGISAKKAFTPKAASGTAPELQVELISRGGVYYLAVRVTDRDGDLLRAAWHSGAWTVDLFVDGGVDWPLTLSERNTAILQVERSGSYTVYAVDRAGHETVRTVTLARSGWRMRMVS